MCLLVEEQGRKKKGNLEEVNKIADSKTGAAIERTREKEKAVDRSIKNFKVVSGHKVKG